MAGALTLFVDGTPFSTADIPGSVSRNSPFGAHIGQRVDSRAHFTGAIDEVRVHDRALSDAEVAGTHPPGAATRGAILWLPMDQVHGGN